MDITNSVICALGDSITAGSGTTDPQFIYHAVLGREMGAREVLNYGIGGTRIARMDCPGENWGPAFVDRYQTMPDTAELVLVFGGTNDYGHGVPLGAPDDRGADTFYGACHQLFSGLMRKYPAAHVVILTPMQRAGCTQPHETTGHVLLDYVDAVLAVAGDYSLPVLDLYRELDICVDIPAQREAFCPDGVHPSDAGNARIAQHLERFLRAL